MKKVVILGSTGSIGISTLKVIDRFSNQFRVLGLTANDNCKLLKKQIARYRPAYVAVNRAKVESLRSQIDSRKTKVFCAPSEIEKIVIKKVICAYLSNLC